MKLSKDTTFANFNYDSTWDVIRTCFHCEESAMDSSGRTYFTKNLYLIDTTQKVKFDIASKKNIYDENGTLGNVTHRWGVFYFKHLEVPECISNEDIKYKQDSFCEKNVSRCRCLCCCNN